MSVLDTGLGESAALLGSESAPGGYIYTISSFVIGLEVSPDTLEPEIVPPDEIKIICGDEKPGSGCGKEFVVRIEKGVSPRRDIAVACGVAILQHWDEEHDSLGKNRG